MDRARPSGRRQVGGQLHEQLSGLLVFVVPDNLSPVTTKKLVNLGLPRQKSLVQREVREQKSSPKSLTPTRTTEMDIDAPKPRADYDKLTFVKITADKSIIINSFSSF